MFKSNNEKLFQMKSRILNYKKDLKDINTKLWDIENGKRSAEKKQDFDEKFIL